MEIKLNLYHELNESTMNQMQVSNHTENENAPTVSPILLRVLSENEL